MTDDDFSDLVEECNSPAAKRIERLERELAEAREQISDMEIRHAATMFHTQSVVDDAIKLREQRDRLAEAREHYRMSSVCRKMKEQRDELSGHYHRLNAENVILQQQRDMLAEALQPFIDGWSDKSCDSIVTEQQFRDAKQALTAVKGGTP
jgi:predicted nuclease with TOPRIM domain